MLDDAKKIHTLHPRQLCVGLYIYLDLGWMDHPFSVSNFKITEESQIATIQSMGLKEVRYDPKRSSCPPLPLTNVIEFPRMHSENVKSEVLVEVSAPSHAELKQKRMKQALRKSEREFIEASKQVRSIHKSSIEQPEQALAQASALVESLVSSVLSEGDMAIQAIQGGQGCDQHYQHELNTLVLCTMLAKSALLSQEEAHILGMATILHDIGKRQISSKILLKKDTLSVPEMRILRSHVELGVDMLKTLNLPNRLLTIVAQHHELADGSGYPKGLVDKEIDALTHILIVVNAYDALCNPPNPADAKSPYEALSLMFAQQRKQFNEQVLKRFIKCLGIYPPGSIIKLSDQRLARVISTNPQQPLRPFLQTLVDDPDEDGVIIDLREDIAINIVQCVKPEFLVDMRQAESLRKQRMRYYLDKTLPA